MPKPDPNDPVVLATRAERTRFADLLSGIAPEDWAHPSLCAGWRIREVVAHITMAYRVGNLAYLGGLVRSGFSFHRFADRAARQDTDRLSDAELLACLRDNIDHPWQPPGGGPAAALSHDVIHGLDVTEPLGLPAVSPETIALAMQGTRPKDVRYFGVDLTDLRLVATDADLALGDGTAVEMTAKELLLTVTGRRPLPGRGGR